MRCGSAPTVSPPTATWRTKIGTYSLAVLAHYHQDPVFTSLPRRPPSTAIARTGRRSPLSTRGGSDRSGGQLRRGTVGADGGRRLQSGVRRHACWADKRLGAGQRGGHPGAGRRRGVCAGQRITDVVPGLEKRFSRARTNTAPLRQDHGYRRGG